LTNRNENEIHIQLVSATARPPTPTACDELRCPCGSLLARLVPGGVELLCRRCRRTVVVPLAKEEARRDG
jgi:hypothetical protein